METTFTENIQIRQATGEINNVEMKFRAFARYETPFYHTTNLWRHRGNVIVKQHTYGCGTNSKACSEAYTTNVTNPQFTTDLNGCDQGCAFFQFRTTKGETKDALGEDSCLGSMSSNQTCSGITPMRLKPSKNKELRGDDDDSKICITSRTDLIKPDSPYEYDQREFIRGCDSKDDFVPYGFFQLHDEFNKFHVCQEDLCNGDTIIPGDNSSKILLGNFFLCFSSIMIATLFK